MSIPRSVSLGGSWGWIAFGAASYCSQSSGARLPRRRCHGGGTNGFTPRSRSSPSRPPQCTRRCTGPRRLSRFSARTGGRSSCAIRGTRDFARVRRVPAAAQGAPAHSQRPPPRRRRSPAGRDARALPAQGGGRADRGGIRGGQAENPGHARAPKGKRRFQEGGRSREAPGSCPQAGADKGNRAKGRSFRPNLMPAGLKCPFRPCRPCRPATDAAFCSASAGRRPVVHDLRPRRLLVMARGVE